MKRAYCKECKTYTFIIDGIKQCCENPLKESMSHSFKVVSQPHSKRKNPSKEQKQRILKIQENKCLYCGKEFGIPYERNGKLLFTKLHWDHLVPYSYLQTNPKDNWAAACHICNGIKSNKMFETIEEVCNYVKYHREKKGYKYL